MKQVSIRGCESYDYDILKKSFENIYWKCPNIIMQLEFNLRFLYFKNEDKLKKHIQKNCKIMLSQFKDGEKNLIDDYAYLREKLENENSNARFWNSPRSY